ncbi:MAG: glycerol kinase GlpK [Lachnospiraceae bacterium]|nr:glycerol kinase GlpK [Lachnospiraceae bacterium]
MEKYVMALDQGTTSSRCILFDHAGRIASIAQMEFTQYYPQPGWVEHDAMEIWSSQYGVAMEAMAKLGVTADNIAAIGITNQRETTIVWDRATGKPICHAIVWQCRRTSQMVDAVKAAGYGDMIREKTGLVPDAYFSASKIAWILENIPGAMERAQNGELMFGNVDTWLIYNLSGKRLHVTDYTNASRTMLFNIHTLEWDDELLDLFEVPKCMLPKVVPSSAVYGMTDKLILGEEIPIAGAAGDQQSALFGQCCFEPGSVKNTYGTGCFLLMNTGHEAVDSKNGLVTTIAASTSGEVEYALEGSVFIGGAVIQWLRDEMRMIRTAKETSDYAERVEDSAGVYLVPAFTGMGAPYWNQYARGTIVGVTRGCKKEHFIRAALESIAYQSSDLIRAMEEDAGHKLTELKVDGGASANNFLLQFQADIIGSKVLRPECVETTALGAAYLAGLAVGYWKDKDEIRENWQLGRTFEPSMDEEKRVSLRNGWKRAIHAAQIWAQDDSLYME